MFTTQCFICKNTPELRRKLEEMGYKRISASGGGIITMKADDGWYYGGCNLENMAPKYWTDSIDCGTNEALFLALAALRDDSDRLQWFIDHENKWLLNQRDTIGEFVDRAAIAGYSCETLRKATPAELIEYFKNK